MTFILEMWKPLVCIHFPLFAESSLFSQSSILAKVSGFARQKGRRNFHFMYGDLYISIIQMIVHFFLVLVFLSFFPYLIFFWQLFLPLLLPSSFPFFLLFFCQLFCILLPNFVFPIFPSFCHFLHTKQSSPITSLYVYLLHYVFASSHLSVLSPNGSLVNQSFSPLTSFSSIYLFPCYPIFIS